MTTYAKRVFELRRALGLSQESLAFRLDVSFATVNRWEAGKTRPQGASCRAIEDLEANMFGEPATSRRIPRGLARSRVLRVDGPVRIRISAPPEHVDRVRGVVRRALEGAGFSDLRVSRDARLAKGEIT